MTLEYSGRNFENPSDIKFLQNPSCGSRVVLCGQADGRKYMTKLIVAFRSSVNAPKIRYTVMWLTVKTRQKCPHLISATLATISSLRAVAEAGSAD